MYPPAAAAAAEGEGARKGASEPVQSHGRRGGEGRGAAGMDTMQLHRRRGSDSRRPQQQQQQQQSSLTPPPDAHADDIIIIIVVVVQAQNAIFSQSQLQPVVTSSRIYTYILCIYYYNTSSSCVYIYIYRARRTIFFITKFFFPISFLLLLDNCGSTRPLRARPPVQCVAAVFIVHYVYTPTHKRNLNTYTYIYIYYMRVRLFARVSIVLLKRTNDGAGAATRTLESPLNRFTKRVS